MGTRYGTRASRSVRLARTMRWATVASAVRNARAISRVVRPPSVRSVSATRASRASAGWQHVKISRSGSSRITGAASARSVCQLGPSSGECATSSNAAAGARVLRRRSSSASRRAAVISQARGQSISSVSANGPSVTLGRPPGARTRTASAIGFNGFPPWSLPCWASSPAKRPIRPIAASVSSGGALRSGSPSIRST